MKTLFAFLMVAGLSSGALAQEPAAAPAGEVAKKGSEEREARRARFDQLREEMRKLDDAQRAEERAQRDKCLQEGRELRDKHRKAREEMKAKFQAEKK